MSRNYKLSNDGTIFEIKEDGSISKIARIDNNGNISSISGIINQQEKNSKGRYVFFIVLFLMSSIVLGIMYHLTSNHLNYYRNLYFEADMILNDISKEYPLTITDIKIGNINEDGDIQTEYGERIYDYNTMYLTPKISYIGLVSGTKELKVKWYTPSGYLSRGNSSPYGFSQSNDEYINRGNNTLILKGWGNKKKGNWSCGTYRIEIWYENTCLKSKTFTIY